MKTIANAILLLLAVVLNGCSRDGSSASGTGATNLSVVVWSSFPPPTNSYRHLEHLTNSMRRANVVLATNQALFSQRNAYGNLPADSPLRDLSGIPKTEPAKMAWSQSMDYRWIRIYSSNTAQRLGWIKLNLHTGAIEAAYDVEALFTISEIEHRFRQVVGTREEALRLFRGGLPQSPSAEQQQAVKVITEALFLPPDAKIDINMSAPGGTNRGHGYLTIVTVIDGRPELVAMVTYGIDGGFSELLAQFGLVRYHYKFGSLSLRPVWTNLNTQEFLLDSDGIPYPKN